MPFGHRVHVRLAPKPAGLLYVLAAHVHESWPAVELLPAGHATHCSPAPVAELAA